MYLYLYIYIHLKWPVFETDLCSFCLSVCFFIGSFKEIPLLEASAISENLFFAFSVEYQKKCAHFPKNACILCKLDENACISKENVCIFIGDRCCTCSSKDPYLSRITFIYLFVSITLAYICIYNLSEGCHGLNSTSCLW